MATDHLEGKRTGRPKGSKGKDVPMDLRRDIMWAYRNLSAFTLKDGKPEPNGERTPRQPSPGAMLWLQYGLKHPERFLDKVVKQALVETKKNESDEPEPGERDLGTERSLELIGDLLADFEAKEAKENAELAARPDAAKIGATLQRSLASALEREKRLKERVKELERNGSARVGG
jgi:hypothetical protein